jgi:hypothetical protein
VLVVVSLVKNPATFSYTGEKRKKRQAEDNNASSSTIISRIFISHNDAFLPQKKKG